MSNTETRVLLPADRIAALEAIGFTVYAWRVVAGFRVEIDSSDETAPTGMATGPTSEKALLRAPADLTCGVSKGERAFAALIDVLRSSDSGGAS